MFQIQIQKSIATTQQQDLAWCNCLAIKKTPAQTLPIPQLFHWCFVFLATMSAFNQSGATLSEKNVKEEYQLNSDQLTKGIEDGKLTVSWRQCHGSMYRLYIRSQIEAFRRTVQPDSTLVAASNAAKSKYEITTKRSRLTVVSQELAGIDARKLALINEKQMLEQWLQTNDPKTAAKEAKEAEKLAKAAEKVAKAAAKEQDKLAKEEAKTAKAATVASKKRKIGSDAAQSSDCF